MADVSTAHPFGIEREASKRINVMEIRSVIYEEEQGFVPFGRWQVMEQALPGWYIKNHPGHVALEPGTYVGGEARVVARIGDVYQIHEWLCPYCGGDIDPDEFNAGGRTCDQSACLNVSADEREADRWT